VKFFGQIGSLSGETKFVWILKLQWCCEKGFY